jgi:hypothetical protein
MRANAMDAETFSGWGAIDGKVGPDRSMWLLLPDTRGKNATHAHIERALRHTAVKSCCDKFEFFVLSGRIHLPPFSWHLYPPVLVNPRFLQENGG